MSNRRRVAVALALGLAALSGCAEKFGEVTGEVALKGKPLAKGVVTFFPEQGTPVAAFVTDGTYTVPALPYGSYRVSVAPVPEGPEVAQAGGKVLKPGEVDPNAKAPVPKKPAGPAIPEKYKSVDTSGLSFKVEQPKSTFPVSLE